MTIRSENPLPYRAQKIGVLRRNGLYWAGSTAWVERIEAAKVFPVSQLVEKARIEIGMPCELVHVMPIADPAMPIKTVGEDAEQRFTPKHPAPRIRRRNA